MHCVCALVLWVLSLMENYTHFWYSFISQLLEVYMETLRMTIEIPIHARHGEGVSEKSITDEVLAQNVSYVLNIFLERYCQYVGAPKLGLISCDGKTVEA